MYITLLGKKLQTKFSLQYFNVEKNYSVLLFIKVVLISKPAPTQIFNLFPANIWIFKFKFCNKKTIKMITLKFKDIYSNPYVLSELILRAKIMRKKNLKIQMLAGNTLKIGVGASFEISTTLGMYLWCCKNLVLLMHYGMLV